MSFFFAFVNLGDLCWFYDFCWCLLSFCFCWSFLYFAILVNYFWLYDLYFLLALWIWMIFVDSKIFVDLCWLYTFILVFDDVMFLVGSYSYFLISVNYFEVLFFLLLWIWVIYVGSMILVDFAWFYVFLLWSFSIFGCEFRWFSVDSKIFVGFDWFCNFGWFLMMFCFWLGLIPFGFCQLIFDLMTLFFF